MARDLDRIRQKEPWHEELSDRALLQYVLDGYCIRIAIYGYGEKSKRQTVYTQWLKNGSRP